MSIGQPTDRRPEPEPVDTLEPPHEPVVVTPSTVGTWSVALAGPVVWIAHFVFVYLVAEAACAAERTDRMRFVGEGALAWTIVVATAAAAAVCVAAAAIAWRRRFVPERRELMLVGGLVAIGSAASVLAVGLPVLALGPC